MEGHKNYNKDVSGFLCAGRSDSGINQTIDLKKVVVDLGNRLFKDNKTEKEFLKFCDKLGDTLKTEVSDFLNKSADMKGVTAEGAIKALIHTMVDVNACIIKNVTKDKLTQVQIIRALTNSVIEELGFDEYLESNDSSESKRYFG